MGRNKKKNRIDLKTIRLDPSFYPKAAIKTAASAFSHLAHIGYKQHGKTTLVCFKGIDNSLVPKELPDEFTNYVLSCVVCGT